VVADDGVVVVPPFFSYASLCFFILLFFIFVSLLLSLSVFTCYFFFFFSAYVSLVLLSSHSLFFIYFSPLKSPYVSLSFIPFFLFFSRLSFLPSLFYFLLSISLFFNSQNPFSLFLSSVCSLLLPKMSFPSLFLSWSNRGVGGARATLPPSSHWDRVRCLRRPLCSCSQSMALLSFYYGGRL